MWGGGMAAPNSGGCKVPGAPGSSGVRLKVPRPAERGMRSVPSVHPSHVPGEAAPLPHTVKRGGQQIYTGGSRPLTALRAARNSGVLSSAWPMGKVISCGGDNSTDRKVFRRATWRPAGPAVLRCWWRVP